MVESAFNKIAGIDSGPTEEVFTKEVFLQLHQNLHRSQRSNMSSDFWKIACCVLQDRNLIKILVQYRLFFQNSLLRELGHSKFIPERICGDVF